MDFVHNLAGEGEDKRKLLKSVFVSLETDVDESLVEEICHQVNRLSSLNEAYHWEIDYFECMLIALGLEAELSKLSVESSAHRMPVNDPLRALLDVCNSPFEWQDAEDCIFR